jgi:16S rRNA (cytosine967-C5)-methyltransferase
MKPGLDSRAAAAMVIAAVTDRGRTLDSAFAEYLDDVCDPRDRAMVRAIAYGVMRFYPRLEQVLDQLLDRPMKRGETRLRSLLLAGLYQINGMNTPAHAAVDATVSATVAIGRPRARGLVNAVMRRYLRERETIDAHAIQSQAGRWAHPDWLIERLRSDWPSNWEDILDANNSHPPMWLRVNRSLISPDKYISDHAPPGAQIGRFVPESLLLDSPLDVDAIDGFDVGLVSVQDGAAQLAAHLLDAREGMRVLDACAAPGGKTAHILELTPGVNLHALEVDPARVSLIESNLSRLKLSARILGGDAADPESWWDGKPYDRLLVDAPCTASGVIRRHPDIKLLRRKGDLETAAAKQRRILDGLWPTLRPGGRMIYATCSVFMVENETQTRTFLERTPDARCLPLGGPGDWGRVAGCGRQILPGEAGMDGFYYACLTKLQ